MLQRKKDESNYKKNHAKLLTILCSLKDDETHESLRMCNYGKYQQYLRITNNLENIENDKILSNKVIDSVHNKITEQPTEIQTDNIDNQRIDQDVEEINHEDMMERNYYSQYCQKCFRKKHKHLVVNIDSRK